MSTQEYEVYYEDTESELEESEEEEEEDLETVLQIKREEELEALTGDPCADTHMVALSTWDEVFYDELFEHDALSALLDEVWEVYLLKGTKFALDLEDSELREQWETWSDAQKTAHLILENESMLLRQVMEECRLHYWREWIKDLTKDNVSEHARARFSAEDVHNRIRHVVYTYVNASFYVRDEAMHSTF
jgi:hypothetical protein